MGQPGFPGPEDQWWEDGPPVMRWSSSSRETLVIEALNLSGWAEPSYQGRSPLGPVYAKDFRKTAFSAQETAAPAPGPEAKPPSVGFPGGPVVGNPPGQAGDMGSVPGRENKFHVSWSS